MFQDRTLTCRDCGEAFVFSSGEQAFFASKGLQHDPQRCAELPRGLQAHEDGRGPREYHAAGLRDVRRPGDGAVRAAQRSAGLLQQLLRQGPVWLGLDVRSGGSRPAHADAA